MTTTSPLTISLRSRRCEHRLFAVIHLGGPAEAVPLFAGDLGHGALGSQIAFEDLDMARRLDRIFDRLEDFLTGLQSWQAAEVFGHRLARAGQAIAIEQPFFQQVFHHRGRAADGVQIFFHIATARLQVRDKRNAVAGALEVIDRQLDVHGPRHGDQMEHGVGRAAEGHDRQPSRSRTRGAS